MAANFIGILILCQVIWAVAEGMFRSEHPKIRESSPTQHAKSKEHTVMTSSDNSNNNKEQQQQDKNKLNQSEVSGKIEQDYYNSHNKVKVKSKSNVWGDYDGAVQDQYSMGTSNSNFINDGFAMNANSASISAGVADRHELHDSLWNAEDKKKDKSKSTWRSWVSKKRSGDNNDNSNTAADDNVNEFDFTSQRQSTSSFNNLNNNQSEFAFVNGDHHDNGRYASNENNKSSYLYDDTAARQQEVAKTKAKTRKQKGQSSDMPYNESSFNNDNIDNRYNDNTTQHMFENTSAPFLVKMDNETEFTSFIDRDEMTGGVKHVNEYW